MMVALNGRALMTNRPQHRGWISKVHLRAASVALIPAVVLVLGTVATESAQARTFTVLHRFNEKDGAYPSAGVIRDAAGNLYGTTEGGGTGCGSGQGCGGGVVFKLDPAGKETVLYNFCSLSACTDGAYPVASLIQDAKGNLYGTTYGGGAYGNGTVFKLSKTGKETVLHSFAGGTADGEGPAAELLRDAAGNFYGTTYYGGGTGCDEQYGCGTVFKLDTMGKETVLYSFTGGSDGGYPSGGLARDEAGNLYGVTWQGGDYCFDDEDCGVVYKLNKNGMLTVLHRFYYETNRDGCFPYGTPSMDQSGSLYGTTEACGGSEGAGIVWKVTQSGTESVLHRFDGSRGASPQAGVIMDGQGNLYGDTAAGGAFNFGNVFELSNEGVLTVLHNFSKSDGFGFREGVIQDAKGNLYGIANSGGGSGCDGSGCGTVWKLTP
jgi:uncharacterized repeat protein (TIGR03803 family)